MQVPATHRTSRNIAPTTAGLAEGLCDLAILRTAVDGKRFASAIAGHERRYCALAADDPWARRRSIRLDEVPKRLCSLTGAPGPPPRTCGQGGAGDAYSRLLRPPMIVSPSSSSHGPEL